MSKIITLTEEHIDDKTLKGMLKRAGVLKYEMTPLGVKVLECVMSTPTYGSPAAKGVKLNAKDPWVVDGKLAVKFDIVVHGDFICRDLGLTSFEGVPKMVSGDFDCTHNPISSWEFAPEKVGGSFIANLTDFTSLEGVDKHVKSAKNFYFPEKKIKSGGIALLNIKNLKDFSDHTTPFKIIKEFLGDSDGMFDCQTRLIDGNFEEFANP